jgi:pimeloyl-ACP methyl ester carboxylesterase
VETLPSKNGSADDCEESYIAGCRVLSRGSGFPLVFVHGFTTTAGFWQQQVAPFAERYRVVRIELRGHGRAGRGPEQHFTIEAFADDVRQVVDELGLDRYLLTGLSMGGTIAQTVALRDPRRIVGLVLVGATAHGLGPAVQAENVIAAIRQHGVSKSAQDVIEASFSDSTPRHIVEWAKAEVTQTPEYVAVQAIQSLNRADSRAQLANLQMPVLVVVGAEDQITPVAESELLAQLIPDADLAVIEKAAHFPMLERPKDFNLMFARFLNRVIPG